MSSSTPELVDVAVVGLNFGAAFVPIYQRHPRVGRVAIVDLDLEALDRVGSQHGISYRYASLDELLATDEWDAVHIATQVTTHGELALRVLQAGRHCASAVPMALEIDQMYAIIDAADKADCKYMMMETSVFAREFFYVQDLLAQGLLGDLTYFKGSHIQNHDGYPSYWTGFPPMAYATHALAPALRLSGSTATHVSCLGSGHLDPSRRGAFDNRFPVELGVFQLSEGSVAAEITMSWYQTARSYQEGFSVYGTKASVEWPQLEGEPLTQFTLQDVEAGRRGRRSEILRINPPVRTDRLPAEIAEFAVADSHGGSHPHLVHEFVSSIYEGRASSIDSRTAARWTAPGLCAHQSAMRGGELVAIPTFQ